VGNATGMTARELNATVCEERAWFIVADAIVFTGRYRRKAEIMIHTIRKLEEWLGLREAETLNPLKIIRRWLRDIWGVTK
jgi:hypothetical protein